MSKLYVIDPLIETSRDILLFKISEEYIKAMITEPGKYTINLMDLTKDDEMKLIADFQIDDVYHTSNYKYCTFQPYVGKVEVVCSKYDSIIIKISEELFNSNLVLEVALYS